MHVCLDACVCSPSLHTSTHIHTHTHTHTQSIATEETGATSKTYIHNPHTSTHTHTHTHTHTVNRHRRLERPRKPTYTIHTHPHTSTHTHTHTQSIATEDWSDLENRGEIVLTGCDKTGTNGWVWRVCRHQPGRNDPDRELRFLMYMMTKALESGTSGEQKLNMLIDCTDISSSNLPIALMRKALPLLLDHFPEVQRRTFIFPVNGLTSGTWTFIIKPLLPRSTSGKVTCVSLCVYVHVCAYVCLSFRSTDLRRGRGRLLLSHCCRGALRER